MKKILVTGCAGFIGFSTAKALLSKSIHVYGIDNVDDYYSKKLKLKRIHELKKNKNFFFYKINIEDKKKLFEKIGRIKFDFVYHFAAQAGVRYSVVNPLKYLNTNINGTNNLFEILKKNKPKRIFFASSSSVYGETKKFPVKENFNFNPKNLYANTKVINEMMAKYYSNFFKMNIFVLRFFTIYGKWGRPDMFIFKILKCFYTKKYFYLNNKGNHLRDFTHIDDAVGILIKLPSAALNKKFDVFNICSGKPIDLNLIIKLIEKKIGKIKIRYIERNNLDVLKTHGSNSKINKLLKNIKKFSNIEKNLEDILDWYKKEKIYKIT